MISERLEHPKLWMIRVVLWLLSTWFGTFIICGLASMSSHFPYFQSFPQVSPHKRHEIVLSWSLSYFSLIRMLFRSLKLVTLLVFFTQVGKPLILCVHITDHIYLSKKQSSCKRLLQPKTNREKLL